tara:strand:- start:452 stop:841 length:390 start_codon:yes stop_codon:yes gene_type:complete
MAQTKGVNMSAIMHLTGNVGQVGELKVTANGKKVTKHRVASNNRGETTWYTVTCWGQRAEYAAQYINKGDTISATGRLEVREYEKRNGEKGFDLELVADHFQGMGKRVKFDQPETPDRMTYNDSAEVPF